MDIKNNEMKKEIKHSVYICFDNNDSFISSFIDYLRVSFNHHGISELDDTSNHFVDLIRVLVVVFSKNYTFSLPENLLNHVIDTDVVVVSVVNGVFVSSVTKQIKVVEPWFRRKLESAVLLSHVYNDLQSESKFMEEIARDVFEKLYPTEEIGIHKLQPKIENLLCKQSWGLRTLGIYGKLGIGKTTLARAVFRKMSSAYDASCFIEDFHKTYRLRLGHLSDEYLSETPVEKFDLNDYSETSHRRKRVLIVLDDVKNAIDAKSYLGNGFGPGSFIIITSRHKQILEEFHVNESYELQSLNQEDAMKLFTRCAFGRDVTEQNLLDFSMKEIQSANGNPLAIRSQARKLASPQDEWYSCSDSIADESQLWYSCREIELPLLSNNVGLVHLNDLMEYFINTCRFLKFFNIFFNMYMCYFMVIVVTWVFVRLWNFSGHWEGLEFLDKTLISLVIVYVTLIFYFFFDCMYSNRRCK